MPVIRQPLLGATLVALLAACGGERDAPPEPQPRTEREPVRADEPAAPELPAARPAPAPPELIEVLQLCGSGRVDEAREVARRYAREHPDDGSGPLMLGLVHRAAGNYEPAAAELRRALELSPEDHLTHRYLGECLFLLGELDGARREYAALRAADPTEPQGELGLGLVELEEGRLDEAEARFRAAIACFEDMRRSRPRHFRARSPELAQCHARLADVHFARGELAAARDELVAATAIEPGNISAFYTLSQVHRRLGEDEAAERALERYEEARAAILRRAEDATGGER